MIDTVDNGHVAGILVGDIDLVRYLVKRNAGGQSGSASDSTRKNVRCRVARAVEGSYVAVVPNNMEKVDLVRHGVRHSGKNCSVSGHVRYRGVIRSVKDDDAYWVGRQLPLHMQIDFVGHRIHH